MNRAEKRRREKLWRGVAGKSMRHVDTHAKEMASAAAHFQSRRYADAERLCVGICSSDPRHAEANHLLGVLALQRNDHSAAVRHLQVSVERNGANGFAQTGYGTALSMLGRTAEARSAFEAAIRLELRSVDAYNNLASLEMKAGNVSRAIELYREALSIAPDKPELQANLANALLALGHVERAIAHYRQALSLRSSFVEARYGLAQALRDLGEIAEAEENYKAALDINPFHANAALSYAMIADTVSVQRRNRIETAHESSPGGGEDRMLLSFALGRISEQSGDFHSAFHHYVEGNAIRRGQLSYSAERASDEIERIISVFDHPFFDERATLGVEDRRPIFIVGMPRSGTTLVEQILASHSQVTGAGELPHFPKTAFSVLQDIDPRGFPKAAFDITRHDVERIAKAYHAGIVREAGDSPHFTDKLPGNFMLAGMIRLVFPNAKIVHCTRDARDTCISMFKTFFPSGGHHFSYDLDEMVEYHANYRRLMDHWSAALPEPLIEVNYESLVTDPEAQIRSLLERCGLDFEPECIEFHKTKRVVRTASAGQVRKPIYTSSIGTWRRFEPFMPSLGAIAA